MNLKKYLKDQENKINKALRFFLPKDNSLIARAMRYSIFAGGKRLRPILVIAGAEVCGANESDVMPAACAVEFIHTYSLIHDDLPAMDNDDLRRGKPTSHKKFNEATAILAGDALLTDAFRVFLECGRNKNITAINLNNAAAILAKSAGYNGMIGGQMIDTLESDNWQKLNKTAAQKILDFIHLNKTAALIQASLVIGASLAGADKKQVNALDNYGKNIGLAFQVADDILDIVGDKKKLGKKGSDKDNNKLTYPALYGLEKSEAIAVELVNNAKKELKIFNANVEVLEKLANFIVSRQY